jgi:IS5 family transposase
MNKKSAFCGSFFFADVVYGSLPTYHNHYESEKGASHKMREKVQKQMPLIDPATDHPQARELEAIDAILKSNPTICDSGRSRAFRASMCQNAQRGKGCENVPADEKIVSIFEPHTDIIVKDRRDVFYGHKICLTGGGSNLILDCLITEGNPADSSLTQTMLERQHDIYGRAPLKAALDGGFASKDNLAEAKTAGVKDVCFAKKRGLQVADMCRSEYVYNRLRKFRAGIESGISWLKRSFGLWRCTWKGLCAFKSYVWCSIVAANLLTLSRHKTAA